MRPCQPPTAIRDLLPQKGSTRFKSMMNLNRTESRRCQENRVLARSRHRWRRLNRMALRSLALLLGVGGFAEVLASHAALGRPHRCVIVIESVDVANRTILARDIDGHSGTSRLRWPEGFQASTSTGSIRPDDLRPGQLAVAVHRWPLFGAWPLRRLEVLSEETKAIVTDAARFSPGIQN